MNQKNKYSKSPDLEKGYGRYWLRVTVGFNGDVLLDNVVISNVRYLSNYLFKDEELALFHKKSDNNKVDNLA